MSTTRPRNISTSSAISMRCCGLALTLMSIRSRSTKSSLLMSWTLTTVTILSSCLRTCSSSASSPWTTKVMRDRFASSVSPTARLSMLKPREASMPEMWASTPGWFCTSADNTCRISAPPSKTAFTGDDLRVLARVIQRSPHASA